MIYLVTSTKELFINSLYQCLSIEDSLKILSTPSWEIFQFDLETTGKDARINKVLLAQFGNRETDIQIVVDCTTIDLGIYKEYIESHGMVGQNLKFDIQFLFNYGIIPLRIYDTMIVEQLLYLGYPKGTISSSLQSLCSRYLNIYLDKSVRGEIIWRGIDDSVILYASKDVKYLEDIMDKQLATLRERKEIEAARIECDFVICCAYYEWCGVKLDIDKWTAKMKEDKLQLVTAKKALDQFVLDTGNHKFYRQDFQGDLFQGFNTDPICTINWNSPTQVIPFLTYLGFKCSGIDKKTKEEKNSIEEKILKPQKGINDSFLEIYFQYTEAAKVVGTYGQGYLNAINPNTGRIHTVFRQLGTDTGRLACGSQQVNTDLAKLKKLPLSKSVKNIESSTCTYPQVQNLPADKKTRSCFISETGNAWNSLDYASQESRLMASLADDKAMIEEFLHGSGDTHSLTAKMVFPELKDVPVKEVKKIAPHLRQEAKNYEFCFNYVGNDSTLISQYGMDPIKAKTVYTNYMNGFSGIAKFQKKQADFVCKNGYILISSVTGHRSVWHDWEDWKERQQTFTREYWEQYKTIKHIKDHPMVLEVKEHFRAKTKWIKNAANSPLQGTGAIIYKIFNRKFFEWIIENNYFNIIKFCIPAHDKFLVVYKLC